MSGDLFERLDEAPDLPEASASAPLADRMRPRDLADVVGPPELVGPESFLGKAIAEDRVPSLVFWGPPGSGKTTLARLIAARSRSRFVGFSAVVSGIKEIKAVMEEAARVRRTGRRTLLFVDEIHRFNRAQQDAFLPFVETGAIILVGATTENPSFELNGALLSRLRVVILPPIAEADLIVLMKRALADPTRGLGARVAVHEDSFEWLGRFADGDARRALTALEAAAAQLLSEERSSGSSDVPVLTIARLEDLFRRKILLYDKSGEEHFNLISALHKSLRDSDVDAALYWLARMLEAGEDPLYVARRLVRFASEDVGLAEPGALRVALDGRDAVDFIGLPEGALALAQVVVTLALAPKSNALYTAYGAAVSDVRERPNEPPPLAIRNAPTKLMKESGYGAGYLYAHDLAEKTAGLDCLPDALHGRVYYRPTSEGKEAKFKERADAVRALRNRLRADRARAR
ncbi:MAG: replication-associated recombination protein A [Thermoanaerobaculia bacterium]